MADAELITPDVTEAATYVAAAWRRGIEAIIETGRRLIEKREQFKNERGKWSMLIGHNQYKGRGVLPFTVQHAYRLIAIAEDQRLVTHVLLLPSDSYTLYQLTRLSDGRFDQLIKEGRIHPGMKRNEASAETRQESKERDEERVLSLQARYRRGINPTGPRGAPEPVIWILWDCFGACSGHRTDITRERTGYMPTDRPGPEGVYGKVVISVHPRMKVDSKHRDVGFMALSGRCTVTSLTTAYSQDRTLTTKLACRFEAQRFMPRMSLSLKLTSIATSGICVKLTLV